MLCLDTSVVVDLLRGETALRDRLEQLKDLHIPYAVTPLTLCELYDGAFQSQKATEAVRLVDEFVESAHLLDFDQPACRVYGQRYSELARGGRTPPEIDLMIASIALAHGAVLVTRNVKDFEHVRGLRLERW